MLLSKSHTKALMLEVTVGVVNQIAGREGRTGPGSQVPGGVPHLLLEAHGRDVAPHTCVFLVTAAL